MAHFTQRTWQHAEASTAINDIEVALEQPSTKMNLPKQVLN